MAGHRRGRAAWALALCACATEVAPAPSPFVARVVSFDPGARAGFGQDRMPDVVLGPPRGGGASTGGTHVVSLGVGGTIRVELGATAHDGPGPDLVVFENAFTRLGATERFVEPGAVELSADGETWFAIPCLREPPWTGCAGIEPVHANADVNDLDATDPAIAGGDGVDLERAGLDEARFVQVTDVGPDLSMGGNAGGFDLDAVAIVQPP